MRGRFAALQIHDEPDTDARCAGKLVLPQPLALSRSTNGIAKFLRGHDCLRIPDRENIAELTQAPEKISRSGSLAARLA